jgi:hypothetical protein
MLFEDSRPGVEFAAMDGLHGGMRSFQRFHRFVVLTDPNTAGGKIAKHGGRPNGLGGGIGEQFCSERGGDEFPGRCLTARVADRGILEQRQFVAGERSERGGEVGRFDQFSILFKLE